MSSDSLNLNFRSSKESSTETRSTLTTLSNLVTPAVNDGINDKIQPSTSDATTSSSPSSSATVQSAVPEALTTQARIILQKKLRTLIELELQRANLDLNLAVNNLLGRGDDLEDGENSGSDEMLAYYTLKK